MQRELQVTADGSHTISIPEMDVTYHSKHGAVQESMHVFIEAGLSPAFAEGKETVNILEIGFGTGLNALLTWRCAQQLKRRVNYITIEKHPLSLDEVQHVNHGELLSMADSFNRLHKCAWEAAIVLDGNFSFTKKKISLQELVLNEKFDCIYFDAFAPSAQPELWTEEIFKKMLHFLNPGGVLVTYCSKGDVRRAMVAAGLEVQKIPGPKGKREMVRAYRPLG